LVRRAIRPRSCFVMSSGEPPDSVAEGVDAARQRNGSGLIEHLREHLRRELSCHVRRLMIVRRPYHLVGPVRELVTGAWALTRCVRPRKRSAAEVARRTNLAPALSWTWRSAHVVTACTNGPRCEHLCGSRRSLFSPSMAITVQHRSQIISRRGGVCATGGDVKTSVLVGWNGTAVEQPGHTSPENAPWIRQWLAGSAVELWLGLESEVMRAA
jgi:hypothetical protein